MPWGGELLQDYCDGWWKVNYGSIGSWGSFANILWKFVRFGDVDSNSSSCWDFDLGEWNPNKWTLKDLIHISFHINPICASVFNIGKIRE
jgi:hypothetical protein